MTPTQTPIPSCALRTPISEESLVGTNLERNECGRSQSFSMRS
jgi:hypothetical protein